MAATAGVLNHQITSLADALKAKPAAPMDSSTSATNGNNSSSDSSDGGATISANDFLTLLVTEMQNQDPTADTDPNEYIDQLVEVNSLEQLIDINQTLSTDLGGAAATSGSGSAGSQTVNAIANQAQASGSRNAGAVQPGLHKTTASPIAQTGAIGSGPAGSPGAGARRTQGNLAVPGVSRAAQRVAHALDGRTRAQPAAGNSPAAQM
jgi:flagellar basal-body rod modification protein FlgD